VKFLLVDDDDIVRTTIRHALSSGGYDIVLEAASAEEGLRCMGGRFFEVAILDVHLPNMSGLDLLKKIKQIHPRTVCIMITAYSDIKEAVLAIKIGAFDYLEKPINSKHILNIISRACQMSNLVQMLTLATPSISYGKNKTIIGSSSNIKAVFELIEKIAKVDASVLIYGESGTGKELVAKALHYHSLRKRKPFVAVNCVAIPDALIESELFGYEKGAFTGADKSKIGKFQFAEEGTLFLDEIGDMSVSMQLKLLRVLQEKLLTPVGSNKEIIVDVRIISATNRPLGELTEQNKFRLDLFYRLNVIPIVLPPLRDRGEDIRLLIKFFIKKFNKHYKKNLIKVSDQAFNALASYTWPGNIRELENLMERLCVLEDTDVIRFKTLPIYIQNPNLNQPLKPSLDYSVKNKNFIGDLFDASDKPLSFPVCKEKFEREFILCALKKFQGCINKTAKNTQMAKATLLRKIKKYHINVKEFKI